MMVHGGVERSEGRRWWTSRLLGTLAVAACSACLLGVPWGAPAMADPLAQATHQSAPAGVPRPAQATSQTASQAPASAASQAPAQAEPPRVQELITAAERSYTSGVTNYHAGHLDAARHDFDAAVDGLLTGGVDVRGDAALSEEMDRLLNAVNSLEMTALKTGNGFSPSIEDAPLAAADQVTFAPNAALTAKIQTELKTTQSDLPLVVNDYVTGFINYYTNNPNGHAHLLRSLERAGKYKDMIQKDLADAGVPQDLIYLGVAESGFQPQAVNAKYGAGGMWQFMPFQGAYGLIHNGYVDERFDPEKSSRAYALYMKSLYNQFGDWYLAMAAFDWGPGNIQRAVMRTGYADFWELYRRGMLPGETKNYVPGIIAAAIMAKNPSQYGLEDLRPMPPVVYDTVVTETAVDLRLIADVTNVSVNEIAALNPSLLRETTPRDGSFDLHIPVGTSELYADRIKEIPEEHRAAWRFHVVKPGETMDGIAFAMHARVSELAEANGLKPTDAVDAGDELVVPITPAASLASTRPAHYRVLRGDSLVTVADRFGVSVEQLRRWNRLRSNAVTPGRTLQVSEPVHLAPTGRARAVRGHVARARAAAPRGRVAAPPGRSGRPAARAGRSSAVHATGTRASAKKKTAR